MDHFLIFCPRNANLGWHYGRGQSPGHCLHNITVVEPANHTAIEISPGNKIATRFLVLTKTKEPVVEEHVREVNPATVKRTLAGVERVWRAIEGQYFYPAPSTMNCSDCGYRAACRAWVG